MEQSKYDKEEFDLLEENNYEIQKFKTAIEKIESGNLNTKTDSLAEALKTREQADKFLKDLDALKQRRTSKIFFKGILEEYVELLKAAVIVLNTVPNRKIKTNISSTTYELASKIDQFLNKQK